MSRIPLQQEIELGGVPPAPPRRSDGLARRSGSAVWRRGEMLLILMGVGMMLVFIVHQETASQWADRPLLPRLSLWIPVTAFFSAYLRRALLGWIDRQVSLGCFLMMGACIVAGTVLPLSWAHALLIGGAVVVFAWWGGWTGLRYIVPVVLLLFLLRPIPAVIEVAVVDSLTLTQANVTVTLMNLDPSESYAVLNRVFLVRDGGPLVGWDPICTVAPECSGYQTLVGGLIFATTLSSSLMIRWPRKMALLLTAIAIALLGNGLRVLMSSFFWSVGLGHWASGTPHAMLGLVIFAVQIYILGWIAGFMGERFRASREQIDAIYQ